MTNFKELKPEEVLEESFIEEYNESMKFLYHQLVNLNVNLFIINKIRGFPFEVFCNSSDTIFFLWY